MPKLTITIPEYCNECPMFETWVPHDVGWSFRQYKCRYFNSMLQIDTSVTYDERLDCFGRTDGREHQALPCDACLEARDESHPFQD